MQTSARRQIAAPEPAPRRRGTLDQVLVDAAMDLFASYGYRGTSLARIAKAAGVTKGALYWHFTDKEDFFLAVVERVLRQWKHTFDMITPATTRDEFAAEFLQTFEKIAELNSSNPWVSRLLLIIMLESHKIGPRVLRAMRRVNSNQLGYVRAQLERGKALGALDPSLEIEWAATQVWTTTLGLQLLWYLHGPSLDLRRSLRRQARELLRQWSTPR
jgi:TetR/AcrR family transcriptional regulator